MVGPQTKQNREKAMLCKQQLLFVFTLAGFPVHILTKICPYEFGNALSWSLGVKEKSDQIVKNPMYVLDLMLRSRCARNWDALRKWIFHWETGINSDYTQLRLANRTSRFNMVTPRINIVSCGVNIFISQNTKCI